jgi:hypothetical protein
VSAFQTLETLAPIAFSNSGEIRPWHVTGTFG